MAWNDLPTDYQDAAWEGPRKFLMTTNQDGSYSFEDVTQYTQIERAYRSAADVNATNAAINTIMGIFEGSYKLLEPTNISIINGDTKAYIKWTDPENGTREDHTTSVQWAGTLVVRKTGSAPKGHNDKNAVVVVDERIRNQYKMSPFTDENLVNGTTYYYGIYPYTSEGKYTDSVVIPFKPSSLQPQLSTITVTTRANATVTAEGSGETIYGTADSNGSCVLTVNYIDRYAVSAVDGNWESVTRRVSVVQGTTSYTVTITTALPTIVSWGTGSDADIVAMVQAADQGDIDLSDYWHVGDTRTIRLPSMSAIRENTTISQQYVDLVLMNKGGKELTTATSSGRTECSFVVGMKDCLAEAEPLYSTGSEASSYSSLKEWKDTTIRSWMNGILYTNFPSSLKPIFKEHYNTSLSQASTDSIEWVNDYFCLFSASNIFKDGITEDDSLINRNTLQAEYAQNQIFEYYLDYNNRPKRIGKNGAYSGYWLKDRAKEGNDMWLYGTYSNAAPPKTCTCFYRGFYYGGNPIVNLEGVSFYGVI